MATDDGEMLQIRNCESRVPDFLSVNIQEGPMIEKVPEILRQRRANEACFAPSLITFGPYHHHHHGKQEGHFRRGQELKIQLVQKMYKEDKASYDEDYYKVVAVGCRVRNCYSEDSTKEFQPADFASMMFLDGCAFLQFISCVVGDADWSDLGFKHHEIGLTLLDVFLLENQLPFLLLEQLNSKTKTTRTQLAERLTKFVEITIPRPPEEAHKLSWPASVADSLSKYGRRSNAQNSSTSSRQNDDPLHLLDSLWRFYVSRSEYLNGSSSSNNKSADSWHTFRSAKDLKAAGIKVSLSETCRFTDIKFNPLPLTCNSYLRLPPIIIDDATKTVLLNLASYEISSNRPIPYAVNSYIAFMDSLIDSPEDVAVLRRSGVIHNCLGSDQEVATTFNDIANDLLVPRDALGHVKEGIEDHYRSTISREVNEFCYTHFRNPWTFMVFIGALLGLGMTFVQTYLTLRNFLN